MSQKIVKSLSPLFTKVDQKSWKNISTRYVCCMNGQYCWLAARNHGNHPGEHWYAHTITPTFIVCCTLKVKSCFMHIHITIQFQALRRWTDHHHHFKTRKLLGSQHLRKKSARSSRIFDYLLIIIPHVSHTFLSLSSQRCWEKTPLKLARDKLLR